MISSQVGIVHEIIYSDEAIQEIVVELDQTLAKAINYRKMTGSVNVGDSVLLNTTANDLDLGSGGWHFVMGMPSGNVARLESSQHIMKLRYTPFQLAAGSCEEQESAFHDRIKNLSDIEGMPVLVGELHSMLPIAATYIKHKYKDLRVVYIMTDEAALSLAFSRNVRLLKQHQLLDGTITVGQGFGGDLEAVNIYTGLVAAKEIMKADLCIVCMGPGITGTGTLLGFSGMGQVQVLHAVSTLGGIPILIPRISEADQRERHQGLSHHTKTVLKHTLSPVHIPILEQFRSHTIGNHHWHTGEKAFVHDLGVALTSFPGPIRTMRRGIAEDPYFFYSVALAAHFGVFISSISNDPYPLEMLSQKWRAWTIL